jgi:hypothetical protein
MRTASVAFLGFGVVTFVSTVAAAQQPPPPPLEQTPGVQIIPAPPQAQQPQQVQPPPPAPPPVAYAPQGQPPMVLQNPGEPRMVRVKSWYGWQTLLVDGAAIAMGFAFTSSDSSGVRAIPGLTYLFGPPIVHWIHGHGAKGAGDLGIRFGLPLVAGGLGALAGAAAGKDSGGTYTGALVGLVVGVLAGYIGAITIDAAILANEKKTEPYDPQNPPDPEDLARQETKKPTFFAMPQFSVQPTTVGSQHGTMGTAGVMGTF